MLQLRRIATLLPAAVDRWLGALSLLDLMGGPAVAAGTETMNVGVLGSGPLQARAKRVICLHRLGAISHVDTFNTDQRSMASGFSMERW